MGRGVLAVAGGSGGPPMFDPKSADFFFDNRDSVLTCSLTCFLFEGVCVETTVIFAQEREESRSETAARVPRTAGIFGAQTLHWPRFYARPPARFEF